LRYSLGFDFLKKNKIYPNFNFWVCNSKLKKDIILDYANSTAIEWYLEGHNFGKEIVDPTADCRLIDYCCSIPESLFDNNGRGKFIFKEMMKHRLSSFLLNVNKKYPQSYDCHHRILNDDALNDLYNNIISDLSLDTFINKNQLKIIYNKITSSKFQARVNLSNSIVFLRKISLICFFVRKRGNFTL
jgi:hypothetical protein